MDDIKEFRGQYFFLSNFYNCRVFYDNKMYQSSEAAFQAQKCEDEDDRAQFQQMTPMEAKKAGKQVKLRDGWDDMRVAIMYDVCLAKFLQNPDLMRRLKQTGTARLEEGNNWGDTFWGVVDGQGKNMLGDILMKIRDEIH